MTRQIYRQVSPLTKLALDQQAASVSLGNQATQVQSQPKSTGIALSGTIGTVEGFTDLRQMLLGDSFAVVYDLENGAIIIKTDYNQNGFLLTMAHPVVQQVGDEEPYPQLVEMEFFIIFGRHDLQPALIGFELLSH